MVEVKSSVDGTIIIQFVSRNLAGNRLSSYDFNDAIFHDMTFEKVFFVNTRMRNVSFNHCTFDDCDFSYANMASANINYCEFTNCEFSEANLNSSSIQQSGFENCKMTRVDLDKTWTSGIHIEQCDFSFSCLTNMFIILSSMINSNLTSSSLYNTVFKYCVLSNNNMFGANTTNLSISDSSTGNNIKSIHQSIQVGSPNNFNGVVTNPTPSVNQLQICNTCKNYGLLNYICNKNNCRKDTKDTCPSWEA